MNDTVIYLAQSPAFAGSVDPKPRISRPPVPIVRPDGIAWDRQQIAQTAKRIEMLDEHCNAVETYIEKGGEFADLHTKLAKNSPKDRNCIGWYRTFEDRAENKFGHQRRTAEGFIAIHAAFFHLGNMLPTSKLPQSFRPLLALARLLAGNLEVARLQRWIADGSIAPTTTEGAIKALAKQVGLSSPRSSQKKGTEEAPSANPFDIAAEQASEAQWSDWVRQNEKKILTAMSVEQRARLLKPAGPAAKSSPPVLIQDLSELFDKALRNQKDGNDDEAIACLGAFNRKYADGNVCRLAIVGVKRRRAPR